MNKGSLRCLPRPNTASQTLNRDRFRFLPEIGVEPPMKAPAPLEALPSDRTLLLEIEPDIVTLGRYLAARQGMDLNEFLEYLITKEASKRPSAG